MRDLGFNNALQILDSRLHLPSKGGREGEIRGWGLAKGRGRRAGCALTLDKGVDRVCDRVCLGVDRVCDRVCLGVDRVCDRVCLGARLS